MGFVSIFDIFKFKYNFNVIILNVSVSNPYLNNITLNCAVEGDPEPKVEAYFESETKAPKVKLDSLSIQLFRPKDVGTYTCIASNTAGTIERSYQLLGRSERK